MVSMVVTLDVLKFSGWLNAFAFCRVETGTHGAGHTVRGGVWARRRGIGGACTLNISSMVLTLDVSKFSGWLNTSASCRAEPKGGGYDARRSVGGAHMHVQRAREGYSPRSTRLEAGRRGHGRSAPRTFPPCL